MAAARQDLVGSDNETRQQHKALSSMPAKRQDTSSCSLPMPDLVGSGGATRQYETFSSTAMTRQDASSCSFRPLPDLAGSGEATRQYDAFSSTTAATWQDACSFSFRPLPVMAANSRPDVQVPISGPCPSRSTSLMVSVKRIHLHSICYFEYFDEINLFDNI